MAEIGLVSSILGVASIGISLTKALYEAADVLLHAESQICSLAKHVSQFTAVLREVSRVLEANKSLCSTDLLRQIRRINRSTRATFKEIEATTQSRLARPLASARWLFKKTKIKELEARLDSQKSTLQIMMHTVTVSRLGQMQEKSSGEAQQIETLRAEINMLRTLIVENHNDLMQLQRAERRSDAETKIAQSSASTIHPADLDATNKENARLTSAPGSTDSSSAQSNEGSDLEDNPTFVPQELAARTSSSYTETVTSTVLLQMVPYRPRVMEAATTGQSQRLITMSGYITSPQRPGWRGPMDEANKSLLLLLDKWTTLGSHAIASLTKDEKDDESSSGSNRYTFKPTVPPQNFQSGRPSGSETWQKPAVRHNKDENKDNIRETRGQNSPTYQTLPARSSSPSEASIRASVRRTSYALDASEQQHQAIEQYWEKVFIQAFYQLETNLGILPVQTTHQRAYFGHMEAFVSDFRRRFIGNSSKHGLHKHAYGVPHQWACLLLNEELERVEANIGTCQVVLDESYIHKEIPADCASADATQLLLKRLARAIAYLGRLWNHTEGGAVRDE